MAAGSFDISIEQGTTYGMNITMTNSDGTVFDLTDWTPRSMIRKKYSDVTETAEFTVGVDLITGTISLSLTPTETAALPAGSFLWDLEIAKAADVDVRRILQGAVTVSPEVTK